MEIKKFYFHYFLLNSILKSKIEIFFNSIEKIIWHMKSNCY